LRDAGAPHTAPSLGRMEATENLPLGLAGSGLLLAVFTCIKSSIGLLLKAARDGRKDGFPFLFETLLIFPFVMQALFYTAQTCAALGALRGIRAIVSAAPSMVPCLFYSWFITSTTLLETYSLQFLPPSMFAVLKQLTMVTIAVLESLILAARPSCVCWLLIAGQATCVATFQYISTAPAWASAVTDHAGSAATESDAGLAVGVITCLISVLTGGLGSVLQQRFMQRQAKAVLVSVKLLYQHVIELMLVLVLLGARFESAQRSGAPRGLSSLFAGGLLEGWNRWAYVVSAGMWLSFLAASSVSAYVSAIAGAFAVAVSVVLTGTFEFLFFGHRFSATQFALMCCICTIAIFYTRERVAGLRKEQRHEWLEGDKEIEMVIPTAVEARKAVCASPPVIGAGSGHGFTKIL